MVTFSEMSVTSRRTLSTNICVVIYHPAWLREPVSSYTAHKGPHTVPVLKSLAVSAFLPPMRKVVRIKRYNIHDCNIFCLQLRHFSLCDKKAHHLCNHTLFASTFNKKELLRHNNYIEIKVFFALSNKLSNFLLHRHIILFIVLSFTSSRKCI